MDDADLRRGVASTHKKFDEDAFDIVKDKVEEIWEKIEEDYDDENDEDNYWF